MQHTGYIKGNKALSQAVSHGNYDDEFIEFIKIALNLCCDIQDKI